MFITCESKIYENDSIKNGRGNKYAIESEMFIILTEGTV